MKKVIFLSEQEFTGWIKNGKWRIEHFISKDLFLKGQFSITEINPRIIYRDFTYLRPLFVEVETNENEEWASLIDITACFHQQKYFAQQQELVHDHFGTSLPISIEKWPLEVEDTIKQWIIDSEFFDAKVGGGQITEMLFTPLYDPMELKQWIKLKQEGLGANSTQSPLCHILQYQRDHQKKGILGAIRDLGLSLKALNEDEQIKTIKDILRPIVTDLSKGDSEILSDSEILNIVRQEICKNDKLSASWKALACSFILYFAMKEGGVITSTTFKIDVCQQFIKQWTSYGFVYEIREACWLLGFYVHASNFSRQYIEWKFQRKELLLDKEAGFQETDCTIPSPSNQNVSTENVPTRSSTIDTPAKYDVVDTSSNLSKQKSKTTQIAKPTLVEPVHASLDAGNYQQTDFTHINEQPIPLAATPLNIPVEKEIQPKDVLPENNVVTLENANNIKQDTIEVSNDREGVKQLVIPAADSAQTILDIADDKQDGKSIQFDEQSASSATLSKKTRTPPRNTSKGTRGPSKRKRTDKREDSSKKIDSEQTLGFSTY